jgi:hypothetical protein
MSLVSEKAHDLTVPSIRPDQTARFEYASLPAGQVCLATFCKGCLSCGNANRPSRLRMYVWSMYVTNTIARDTHPPLPLHSGSSRAACHTMVHTLLD